jgi:hypothetical protein
MDDADIRELAENDPKFFLTASFSFYSPSVGGKVNLPP